MSKLRIAWLILLAAFIFTGTSLSAQVKKEEVVQPIQQEKPKGPEKLMIFNGDYLKAQLYGWVRMDMVYNTTNVRHESGPLFVENQVYYFDPTLPLAAGNTSILQRVVASPSSDKPLAAFKKTASQRDGSFVMDMRTTRLGVKVTGPTVLMAKTSALVEFDFWGTQARSGTANRQGMIRMRHAIGRLDWPSGTFLVFGQYWSVVMAMPAQPLTVTFIPFGESGNLFMREPMVWLGQKIGNEKYNLTVEAAAARVQAGADTGTASDLYPGNNDVQLDDRGPGEASKMPGGRARITFVMKPIDLMSVTLGGSGHYQLEKHAFTFVNLNNQYIWGASLIPGANTAERATNLAFLAQKWGKLTRSYSAGAFGKISVSLFTLLGTYWWGTNMDGFLSGLGQNGAAENYTCTKILGIPEQGGYGQVQIDLRKIAPIPIVLAAGYGGIKKSNKRYVNVGNILWNETIQANIFWYINDYMHLAFEYARHQTKFKGALGTAVDHRFHPQFQFGFM